MKYRKFYPTGEEVSLLGFGAMRIPTLDSNSDEVNVEEAIKLIRYAIDNGVNYVDTAYVYSGGKNEGVVAKALEGGYREKVFIATKMPVWFVNEPADMEEIFNTQLERLETDCIDMYLVHGIMDDNWSKIQEFKFYDFLSEKRAAGQIKNIGFSFHGLTTDFFKEVIDAYPWDFAQIQLNYMDKNIQAGVEGCEYAHSKKIPIIVMEPLKGGKLTDIIPPTIQNYWNELKSDRSPAEWALRWVANLPGVTTILSGMNTMEQIEENLIVLSNAEANALTDEELEMIDKVSEEYNKLIKYSCTGCKYCMPCPQGIDIPNMMDYRNFYDLFGGNPKISDEFTRFIFPRPSECIECKQCEDLCPQNLEIAKAMKETAEIYE